MNKYFLFTWNEYPDQHDDVTRPSQRYKGSFASIEAAIKAARLSYIWCDGGVNNSAEILTIKDGNLITVISGSIISEEVHWKLPDGTVECLTAVCCE